MFQNHDVMPHEFHALEPRYKTFMYASEMVVMDEEQAEAEAMRKKGGKR